MLTTLLFLFALPELHAGDSVVIGKYDVETLFFISKSDDHNRVDYGIRLDKDCHPVSDDDAVFYYWREFENSPPVRTHGPGFLDGLAYGTSKQRTVTTDAQGVEYSLKIKHIDREVRIKITRAGADKCAAVASMDIANVHGARLTSAFLKLGGGFSVKYIDLHGTRPDTGAPLEERLNN